MSHWDGPNMKEAGSYKKEARGQRGRKYFTTGFDIEPRNVVSILHPILMCMWVVSYTTKQFSNTSCASYNSTQF